MMEEAKTLTPVAVSIVMKVPHQVLEAHSSASAELVGHELAHEVNQISWRRRLGYFPALGYFMDHGGIDESLLDACGNLSWLAKELVQDEIHLRLNGVFAGVEIASIRSTAFTMPTVRPRDPNALSRLAVHYAPDAVRTTLVLDTLEDSQQNEASTVYARRMLWRWLKDHFSAMEVTSSRVVGEM